ncbi:hypothetical protein B0T26DRAFT_539810 [Lasiosphaeria miniovina]|uniref:SNF2 N-terminal domain-containing protein n=1 Tax=Lasiosphaeria miniovina TaxID=1954250 RepID=A0AA39ZQY9_9PEZI|nr:uncharacterized protein B0T26DRAFT_539810 [Lasiosphaeria miniovina]KAK0702062.1 hypothetical protein B0T26DRAFT_539810 [Lasiosphaeria miniovina]
MRGDERAIGAKLSDAGLFLQHPAAHECSSQNVSFQSLSLRKLTRHGSHQLVALAMMIERECGIVENPRYPTLWASTTDNQPRQIITSKYRDSPVPVYGGVSADEMGLGKTLSVLALICSSLDDLHHHQSASQQESMVTGTLMVAPKSKITAWQEQIDRSGVAPFNVFVSLWPLFPGTFFRTRSKSGYIMAPTAATSVTADT